MLSVYQLTLNHHFRVAIESDFKLLRLWVVICYYGAFHTLVQDSVWKDGNFVCWAVWYQCKAHWSNWKHFLICNSELLYFEYIYSLYINTVSVPERRIVFQEYCLFPHHWGAGHGWWYQVLLPENGQWKTLKLVLSQGHSGTLLGSL